MQVFRRKLSTFAKPIFLYPVSIFLMSNLFFIWSRNRNVKNLKKNFPFLFLKKEKIADDYFIENSARLGNAYSLYPVSIFFINKIILRT